MLVAAERRGPIRLSDLAGFAGLNPTMLSRLVPKLEEAGLVARLADEEDRRVLSRRGNRGGAPPARAHSLRTQRCLVQAARELSAADREAVLVALPVLEELAEKLLGPEAGRRRTGRNR